GLGLAQYFGFRPNKLMSKGALESWLDENPGSSQNICGMDNERMSSARISIEDISGRVKHKTYTLLDPTYRNGLRVPLSKLYLSDEDSALSSESSDQSSPPDER
ncbi:hypothetical protein Tco_0519210, partial [Tanacetum coccineum]